jgi:segregation and condensation protein B
VQAELLETGSLARAIEALLFVASESLSIKVLAKLTRSEEADVTVALQQIDADYASRGIVLREVAGGYRFATAPTARSVVEAYLMPPKTNLSPAALETLAIVAYMQPVTKGDIEGIRGVNADSVLSTLVDRRFLAEAGRKDVAGRPILYKTTPEFLEAFGLRSLEELPPIDIEANAPVEFAFPVALAPGQRAAAAEPELPNEPEEREPITPAASAARVHAEGQTLANFGAASFIAAESDMRQSAAGGSSAADESESILVP